MVWTASPTYGELPRTITDVPDTSQSEVAITDDGFGEVRVGSLDGGATETNVYGGTGDVTVRADTTGDIFLLTADGDVNLATTGGDIVIAPNTTTGKLTLSSVYRVTEVVAVGVDPAPTVGESNKTFFCPAIGATTITVPAPVAGLQFNVVMTGITTGVITVDCGAGLLIGRVFASSGGNEDSGTADRNILFTAGSGAGQPGDLCELVSDGTSWIASCFCDVTGGITFS